MSMNEQNVWVRFVAACTIVGRNYQEGDIAEFNRETARELFRMARAVPSAGRGRMFTTDSVGIARARRAA